MVLGFSLPPAEVQSRGKDPWNHVLVPFGFLLETLEFLIPEVPLDFSVPGLWDNGSKPSPDPLSLPSSRGRLDEIPHFRLSEFPVGSISPARGVEEELGMEWEMEKPLWEQPDAALGWIWGESGARGERGPVPTPR